MPEERATIKENRVGVKVYIINKPLRCCYFYTLYSAIPCNSKKSRPF